MDTYKTQIDQSMAIWSLTTLNGICLHTDTYGKVTSTLLQVEKSPDRFTTEELALRYEEYSCFEMEANKAIRKLSFLRRELLNIMATRAHMGLPDSTEYPVDFATIVAMILEFIPLTKLEFLELNVRIRILIRRILVNEDVAIQNHLNKIQSDPLSISRHVWGILKFADNSAGVQLWPFIQTQFEILEYLNRALNTNEPAPANYGTLKILLRLASWRPRDITELSRLTQDIKGWRSQLLNT